MTYAQRLLFCTTHIYLLLTAMLNLALGMSMKELSGWPRMVQRVGSIIILATPIFALTAFFIEPWLNDLERPYSRACAYCCLAGMMVHLLSWLACWWRQKTAR